jgi:hypothetical protein
MRVFESLMPLAFVVGCGKVTTSADNPTPDAASVSTDASPDAPTPPATIHVRVLGPPALIAYRETSRTHGHCRRPMEPMASRSTSVVRTS